MATTETAIYTKIEQACHPYIFYPTSLTMAATNKISVISPAPATDYRPGAVQQMTWAEVNRRATRFDEEGFPLEGSFGVSWAAPTDLRGATKEQIVEAMRGQHLAAGQEVSAATLQRDTRMLLEVFNHLKKGETIAFKKGTTIVAFVQLTSDYRFCPEERWGWHTWNYRLVRKATAADQPANKGALVKTFFPNFLARPTL